MIANKEALAVNEAWVGDAGVLVKKSDELVPFTNCHWGPCSTTTILGRFPSIPPKLERDILHVC